MMLSLEMGEASIAKKLTNMYDRKMNMKKSTFYCEQNLIYSDDDCSSRSGEDEDDIELTCDEL